MKKLLLLISAVILLLGMIQKFDGQEMTQSHRQLPGEGKAVIERQGKMAHTSFFSMQEPDCWTIDQTFPHQHPMTTPMGHQDYIANATMIGKSLARHELSAGVDTAWVRHYASGFVPSHDEATAIAVDGSGNVYVTGNCVSFPSGYDYLTVKYNPSGSLLWTARYNGPGNSWDEATALAVDASGNVYMTGGSEGDYATVKYNSEGVEQWVARYNGPGNSWDRASALAMDSSGNVYVTGSSGTIKYNSDGIQQWVASQGANALAVDDSCNICVTGSSGTIKYNSDGIQQWVASQSANALAVDDSCNVYVTGSSRTIKYNSAGIQKWVASQGANALAVDVSGNVYVTGTSRGSDTGYDYATIKYNSAGTEQWVACYNGPENINDYAVALVVDASGNVYVTGGSLSISMWFDYATIKYNSEGVEQWVARYNGPGNDGDYAYALAMDASGNIYVTGGSKALATGRDFATVKYNSDGVQQWVARYNGLGNSSQDEAYTLAVDVFGNVYVTGSSRGSTTMRDYATIKYNSEGMEQWVARYNGPGNAGDGANALALDASSNVYVTGSSGGDFATVKYNSEGIELWVARYNGPGNAGDGANALAVDASGNVYVTGASEGSTTYLDYATVKYNSSGIEQWVARYNGPGNDEDRAYALAVDDSGNVYVSGLSNSSSGNLNNYDYATIKYNSAGVQQWMACYNGPGNANDRANSLVVDASGNVYLTGGSEGSTTGEDYATVKYNSEGIEQWVVRYNGPGNADDEANDLAVDASGNVYVTGTSQGSTTDEDYATVKYNSEGIEQWVARYNGPEIYNDYAIALVVDATSNVYVTGLSEGDLATVKYNSEGVEQWVARYNGPENAYDQANSLVVDASGNVYVSGTSAIGYGWYAGWSGYTTIKYVQTPVSVETKELDNPNRYWLAQNYPNPFNPSTTIEFVLPKSAFVTLKVYNLLGEEVTTLAEEQRAAGIHKLNWDASGLASGVYLYRLEAGNPSTGSGQVFVQMKKLILIH